jgi:4a-hydroxytetrahydrobiopterin dehydratase
MARPKLYTEEEIEKIMPLFPYWDRDDKKIVRELVGRDFINAVGMVTSIAIVAEKMDHHPDIFLYGYNKIRVSVTTGDQGGLTELDFNFARAIDELGFHI